MIILKSNTYKVSIIVTRDKVEMHDYIRGCYMFDWHTLFNTYSNLIVSYLNLVQTNNITSTINTITISCLSEAHAIEKLAAYKDSYFIVHNIKNETVGCSLVLVRIPQDLQHAELNVAIRQEMLTNLLIEL